MPNLEDAHNSFPYMLMHLKNRVLQLNPYEGMTFFSLQRFFSDEYYARKFIPFNYYEFGVSGRG